LAAGSPEQAADLVKLRGLLDAKKAELAPTIVLADMQVVGAAFALVRRNQGNLPR
jgi:CHASE3 domain sensor protein